MTDGGQPLSRNTGPPEFFLDQVRDALQHLYDVPYLERHPLVAFSALHNRRAGETPGQCLRRKLVMTIEALNPGPGIHFLSPHARPYNMVHLHYVEGATILEAANDLAISRRQAYRDLREGEEAVASILWRLASPDCATCSNTEALSPLQAEVRLARAPRVPTNINSLLQHALGATEQLAQKYGVRVLLELPRDPVTLLAESAIAQQAIVGIISHAIQQARPGGLSVVLTCTLEQMSFVVRYSPRPGAFEEPCITPLVAELLDRLHWTVRQADEPDIGRTVIVRMSLRSPMVLVVDDNEGIADLLERYLSGAACELVAAHSGSEGLQLARELIPDVIILDIMMPEMDGWEFLQRLRANPETNNIPVIICSVVNDPELAYSLGASRILSKPISRDQVVAALQATGLGI